ncbi:MAG: pyridoxal phosphate-dependent aminotransferase [Gemmatimonadetes bacterium]|nr:MAG: pyridoxal phosphate-dependent aminotransferase [Gemmatimonadota bacterium]
MAFTPVPFDAKVVASRISECPMPIGIASIREVNKVVNLIEQDLGVRYIRMEFGIPGLSLSPIALDGEKEALVEHQLGSVYPSFEGAPELKQATADFCHAFLNLKIDPKCCIPTNGAMQGGFVSIGVAGNITAGKDTILFLMPGFPVNQMQVRLWGLKMDTLDLYDHRGEALLQALENRFAKGDVGGLLWSSPNNPTWVCLKEEELQGIGELCTKYDVMAIEDYAYLGMDFRQNYGVPYKPPYAPTVAHYTDNYVILISGSKMFSYAGQRIGVMVISPAYFERTSAHLKQRFIVDNVGYSFIHPGVYATTAGVSQGAQHGLAALLRASVAGEYDFLKVTREYADRAAAMKKAFLDNGFQLVYDNDLGEPLADGFYFTLSYPNMTGPELVEKLLYYGVSAITLKTAGSVREEGIRACVSLTPVDRVDELAYRMQQFHADHPVESQ